MVRVIERLERAEKAKEEIEQVCIKNKMNLTIFNGAIGFVDPEENKIVALWKPEYKVKVEVKEK